MAGTPGGWCAHLFDSAARPCPLETEYHRQIMASRWPAIGVQTDPLRRARQLERSWERLLSDGALARERSPGATRGLRAAIVESWRRSLASGLAPTDSPAPIEADESEVLERWAAHPVGTLTHILTDDFRKVAEESRSIVVVTDPSGLVLHRVGDPGLKELAAEQSRLVEGACWSESAAGTNGIGTALAVGRAFQVFASEHFNRRHHPWVCSGAPILDPATGRTIGLIDLSSHWKIEFPRSLELVTRAAGGIEQRLADVRRDQNVRLRRRYGDLLTRSTDLLVDREGYVLDGAQSERSKTLDVPEGGGEVVLSDGSIAVADALGQGEAYLLRRVGKRHPRSAPASTSADVLERAETHVRELLAEQSALRHVATLVARESSPDELFAAVAEQVARVFDVLHVRLVRFEPEGTVVVGGYSEGDREFVPIGSRWPIYRTGAIATVRQTGRPARAEDYTHLTEDVAEVFRGAEVRSAVASPIVVEGRVWGAMVVHSLRDERFPDSTEARLEDFTALVATAIANAESRAAVARLADEQAALQRVAVLVAQGVSPRDLFEAVTREVGRLLPVGSAMMGRFEPDGNVTSLASWSSTDLAFPTGVRWPTEGTNVAWMVLQTSQGARIDDFSAATDPIGVAAREAGVTSAVGSPIVVEGSLWGLISANSTDGPLPPDTEARLASFTGLVATAIANTEAREALAELADEQAALRRVATLVAQDAALEEIFSAVSAEVDRAFRLDPATFDIAVVGRFDPGPEEVVVATSKGVDAVSVGSRWQPDELFAPTHVLRTGRSARIRAEDVASAGGEVADFLRQQGYLSQVASPIVVDGLLWGALSVNAKNELPRDTEERLERFTDLVATAIVNVRSRAALARLADEQSALRRVATLVAEEPAPGRIFEAVCEQVGLLLEADITALEIFPDDGTATVIAVWGRDGSSVPVGKRVPVKPNTIAARILSTRTSARRDTLNDAAVEVGPFAQGLQLRSTVGAPILVGGRLWGALMAGTRRRESWAEGAESRLSAFTELVATAIANSESREERDALAGEQTALRRVATLVAEEAAPARIFEAVCEQVGLLLQADLTALETFPGDDTATVLALWNRGGPSVPVGTPTPLEVDSIAAQILSTREPARMDGYEHAHGELGELARDLQLTSTVGVPILVGGRLWGALIAATRSRGPWVEAAEIRLLAFTELVATAIANAESRDALARLAEEQAALRRVATLVARDAPPSGVFDAVAMEVGTLLDTDITVVGRYDGDGAATAIGSWSSSPGGVPVGTRSALGGHNVLTLVAATERPARVDGYDDASGEAAEIARRHRWSSSIAAPIIVEGRLWGAMLVANHRPEPFPAGAEYRLAAFTDLLATALANAKAHDELRRFGEEQAALGRVATLVAAGAAPERVFAAVVEEVSSLLELERIELVHYAGDGRGTVVAASGDHPFAAGTSWSLDDPSVMATVAWTGRAARVDGYTDLDGEIARAARGAGFQSAIGAPITVEGRLWGVIIAISTNEEPIPDRSEDRLGQFTELVATAVANAESRDALSRLAEEQAALQRVATLVARGVEPEAIFSAVGEEVGGLFGSTITTVGRFEPDAKALVVVGLGKGNTGMAIGSRWELDDPLASAQVLRTGRSARVDEVDWSGIHGPLAPFGPRLSVASTVASPIFVEGRLWGVVSVSDYAPLPYMAEVRLEKFSALIATALANAEGKSELAASRRRIVAAADEARRRIERDLHDGIQQRLIALTFHARAMTRRHPEELAGMAAELSEGLREASDELREISRGIHPTILTEAGLGPALRALARRSEVPVDVDVRLAERLPPAVEAAAYYIASEALTNVAKHAHASVVELIAAHDEGTLTVEVRDDGIGGVDATRGSGILGLADRIEALGGTISISSPLRGGTTLSVCLPVSM